MRPVSKLAVVVLGALALAAVLLLTVRGTSARRPIGFGLQSYAKGQATVTITNLTRSKLDYVLKVERKTGDHWPTYEHGIPLGTASGKPGSLEPGQVSTVDVDVMVYAPPCPFRVSVFCCMNAPGPDTTRFKAGLWLMKFHVHELAQKAFGEFKVVQVSGPQMEQ